MATYNNACELKGKSLLEAIANNPEDIPSIIAQATPYQTLFK
jgi:hypothetical protein